MTPPLLDHELDALATLARAQHTTAHEIVATRQIQAQLEADQIAVLAPILTQTLTTWATLTGRSRLHVPLSGMTWVHTPHGWERQNIFDEATLAVTSHGTVYGRSGRWVPRWWQRWREPNGSPADHLAGIDAAAAIREGLNAAVAAVQEAQQADAARVAGASPETTIRLLTRAAALR